MLFERPPPVGAMPLVGVNCLRLAGRALVSPRELGGSEAGEEEGAGARVASSEGRRSTALERLPEIQVGGGGVGIIGCKLASSWVRWVSIKERSTGLKCSRC